MATFTIPNISDLVSKAAIYISGTPAFSTGSTSGVMLGAAAQITPNLTGNLCIIAGLTGFNNTLNDNIQITLRYGTGTPPVQNGAVAGTEPLNATATQTSATVNAISNLSVATVVPGLLVATTYWIDLQVQVNAGTGTFATYQITAFEL